MGLFVTLQAWRVARYNRHVRATRRVPLDCKHTCRASKNVSNLWPLTRYTFFLIKKGLKIEE